MKLIYIIPLIFCACASVVDNKVNEKYQNLSNLFRHELNEQLPESGIIVILQNQRCISCRYEVFHQFSNYLKEDSLKKTFIIGRVDTALNRDISSFQNKRVIIDSLDKRVDYGLDYAADLFFLIRDNKIKEWFEISNTSLGRLKAQ